MTFSVKKFQAGFTLLELLVVIAIIGILIALGTAAFSTAQQRGRDAKRRGDMKAMQNGFEQFYADPVAGNGTYADCASMAGATYLPGGLPEDPKNSAPYVYACSGDAISYCACATLESPNGNASDTSCTYVGTGGDTFCVSNLQ